MPPIHTHLHLALLFLEKTALNNPDIFLLGTAYPDCFDLDEEAFLYRHGRRDAADFCDYGVLTDETRDEFTLGWYFHLWTDNHIREMELEDISRHDCLICDMDAFGPVWQRLSGMEWDGKRRQAMENIQQLACQPMPLYLVFDEKKRRYRAILEQLVEKFIQCLAEDAVYVS